MKTTTRSIFYGKTIPNIPFQKKALKNIMSLEELAYAKEIANEFLTKTFISKVFFDEASVSTKDTIITRIFSVKNTDVTINNNILDYAALTIFGTLFANDSCPESLDLLLGFKGTASAQNNFVITLSSQID